jgi:hypothetical protein
MNTQPKYPKHRRSTSELLVSLILSGLMLAAILYLVQR